MAIGRDDFHHGYFGANVWQLGPCPRILLFYGEALRPKPEKAGVGTARCRQMVPEDCTVPGFNTTPALCVRAYFGFASSLIRLTHFWRWPAGQPYRNARNHP